MGFRAEGCEIELVGRHKINGQTKHILVEMDVAQYIEKQPGKTAGKKLRRIMIENSKVAELKEELEWVKEMKDYLDSKVDDLIDRINFARMNPARGFIYPPWLSNGHLTIGASFSLLIPRDDEGNPRAFDVVFRGKCTICKDRKCCYDLEELSYHCVRGTRRWKGISIMVGDVSDYPEIPTLTNPSLKEESAIQLIN